MIRRISLLSIRVGLASVVFGSLARDFSAAGGHAADMAVKGQRIFTCGHSFHVFVYPLLGELAKAAGIDDQELVGLSRIGGSKVIQHWAVADEKNAAKAALVAGKVDV